MERAERYIHLEAVECLWSFVQTVRGLASSIKALTFRFLTMLEGLLLVATFCNVVAVAKA